MSNSSNQKPNPDRQTAKQSARRHLDELVAYSLQRQDEGVRQAQYVIGKQPLAWSFTRRGGRTA